MTLTIDDLLWKCKTCGGAGKVVQTGGGGGSSFTNEEICPECKGGGTRLTESGKAVEELYFFLKKKWGS